jgi:hypothetical protein
LFVSTLLTETQLRSYSDEHLAYEATALFLAGRTMERFARPSNLGELGIQLAVIESFALHVRNMIDFFFAKHPQATDVIAGHFFDDWETTRPALSVALETARGRASREVAQLTTLRIAGTPVNKLWQPQPLLTELRSVIGKFLAGASDMRLGIKARLTLRDLVDREIDLAAPVLPGVHVP